jgi:hypothetical protein
MRFAIMWVDLQSNRPSTVDAMITTYAVARKVKLHARTSLAAAMDRRGNRRRVRREGRWHGQKPGYRFYEKESGRRTTAKTLTKDEARRIAANAAKLPELLQR